MVAHSHPGDVPAVVVVETATGKVEAHQAIRVRAHQTKAGAMAHLAMTGTT